MIPKGIKEEEFVYTPVPNEQVVVFCNEFIDLLDDFSNTISFEAELCVNVPAIVRICQRVDQRKDYYMYYHTTPEKVMHMSHEKEMGLWAYWVSKYKPVYFSNKEDEKLFFLNNGCSVSDAFAAYIIISIVCHNNKSRAKYFAPEKVASLYYDLANRDFSKEAIISRIEDLIS